MYVFKNSRYIYSVYGDRNKCLIRDISEINLFFETILKLIDINIIDLNEIARIMGISFRMIKDIIVDMVSNDFITVSENYLNITQKGKNALLTRKQIKLKKENINNIMINLITGEIVSDDIKINSVNKSSVCLAENFNIDNAFLETHFQDINKIYQEHQAENSSFGKENITKELYKIIAINYTNLRYVKNGINIYKSENTNDLKYIFMNEKSNMYFDTLIKQLQRKTFPSLSNFFEQDRKYINDRELNIIDIDLQNAVNKIRENLLTMDKNDEIEEILFSKKRFAIYDNEYENYFLYDSEFKYSKIIIYSNRIKSILTPVICNEINRLAQSITVVLLYDKNEYFVDNHLNFYFGHNKPQYLHIIQCDRIDNSVICFDQSLLIRIPEYTEQAFESTISYKLPILDFDKGNINNWISNISEKFDLNKLFIKMSKKGRIKQKKR